MAKKHSKDLSLVDLLGFGVKVAGVMAEGIDVQRNIQVARETEDPDVRARASADALRGLGRIAKHAQDLVPDEEAPPSTGEASKTKKTKKRKKK